jgi:predicted molibdopterin-dependent oxidoreductase YjgC
MKKMPKLIVDGKEIEAREGLSLLKACQEAGIYVPALCSHPDLRAFSASKPSKAVYRTEDVCVEDSGSDDLLSCGLCIVEMAGKGEPVLSCETQVEDGMNITTHSEALETLRRQRMSRILTGHPRHCLICPNNEGCDRLNCSMSASVEQRCCDKFIQCELRAVVDYVGMNRDIPEYVPGTIPLMKGGKLFEYNLNLCIGCLRCVRACQDLQEVGALSFVRKDGRAVVGTLEPTLAKSGCKFCGACVAVCPTGAMMPTSDKCGAKLSLSAVVLPPKHTLPFTAEAVESVPEDEGVIQLLDEKGNVAYIAGSSNMRKELKECLKSSKGVACFVFEPDSMYTQRQNELLSQYIETHGNQPRINAELDDLF